MKITIQKTMNVQDPTRAHDTDAGLDLRVPEGQGVLVRPGAVYTVDLGVRVAIPEGYYGQVALRSSAGKAGLSIPNAVGVVDSGYRGNLKLLVTAIAAPVAIATGESVCQLIILPLPHVDVEIGVVDDSTDRGAGGFGSTGIGAVVRDYGGGSSVNRLTIGRLAGQLQDAAFRYGNDTPVAVIANGGAGYEQGDALSIINAIKTGRRGGWAQYQADRNGAPMAVIS